MEGKYMMRSHLLAIIFAILFSLSSTISVSALPRFFFPNISSIPPELLPNATKPAWDAFHNFSGCRPGDKTDGLSKLKKYFQYFGYIDHNSSSNSNFTDDFDDALELAIKTYQRNFNLNETGELDDATLKQIVRPRCGNADVVNGSSSMNSGNAPPSSSNFHTVGHYTFFPNTPRWPGDRYDLTYAFNTENQLSDTVKAVFASAFAKWSQVTPLTFTATDSFTAADIKIGFYTGDHGDGEPFDGVLGTLAHAFSPTSGRLHLDGAESWVVEGDITKSTLTNAVDLESVAVHEIGHLLGLGHSSVEDAIMYPTISSGTRKVELATDDINGVQYLYGSNPNYNGSTTTTASQDTSPGSGVNGLSPSRWGLSLLAAVGFVLMLV